MANKKINNVLVLVLFLSMSLNPNQIFTVEGGKISDKEDINNNIRKSDKVSANEVDTIDTFDVNPNFGTWNVTKNTFTSQETNNSIYRLNASQTIYETTKEYHMNRGLQKTDATAEMRLNVSGNHHIVDDEYFNQSINDPIDFNDNLEYSYNVLGNITDFNDGSIENMTITGSNGTLKNYNNDYLWIDSNINAEFRIVRQSLNIDASIYKYFSAEFYSNVSFSNVTVIDGNNNTLCGGLATYNANTWYLIGCALTSNWSGTETGYGIVYVSSGSQPITVFVNVIYLFNQTIDVEGFSPVPSDVFFQLDWSTGLQATSAHWTNNYSASNGVLTWVNTANSYSYFQENGGPRQISTNFFNQISVRFYSNVTGLVPQFRFIQQTPTEYNIPFPCSSQANSFITCDLDLSQHSSWLSTTSITSVGVIFFGLTTLNEYRFDFFVIYAGGGVRQTTDLNETSIISGAIIQYINPEGRDFIHFKNTMTATTSYIKRVSLSINANLFSNVSIRLKSNNANYFSLMNKGNIVASAKLSTANAFELFVFDLSLSSQWTGTVTDFRIRFNSVTNDSVLIGDSWEIDYLLLFEKFISLNSSALVIQLTDRSGIAVVNISQIINTNSFDFMFKVDLLAFTDIAANASTSWFQNGSLGAYYVIKFKYNILLSQFQFEIYNGDMVRKGRLIYPTDFSETNKRPELFAIGKSPNLKFIMTSIIQTNLLFELDYIKVPFLERHFQKTSTDVWSSESASLATDSTGNSKYSEHYLMMPFLDYMTADLYNAIGNTSGFAEGNYIRNTFNLYVSNKNNGAGLIIASFDIITYKSSSSSPLSFTMILYFLIFKNFTASVPVYDSFTIYKYFYPPANSIFDNMISFTFGIINNRADLQYQVRMYPNMANTSNYQDFSGVSNLPIENGTTKFDIHNFKVVTEKSNVFSTFNPTNFSLLVSNFDYKDRDIFQDIVNGVGQAVGSAFDTVMRNTLNPFFNLINKLLTTIFRAAMSIVEAVINTATSLVLSALAAIPAAITTLGTMFTTVFEAFGATLSAALGTISNAITGALEVVANAINSALSALSAAIDSALGALGSVINLALDAIGSLVAGAIDALTLFIADLTAVIASWVSDIWNFLVDNTVLILQAVLDALIGLISFVIDLLHAILTWILVATGTEELFTTLVNIFFMLFNFGVALITTVFNLVVFVLQHILISLSLVVLLVWMYILFFPIKIAPTPELYLEEAKYRFSMDISGGAQVLGVKLVPFSYLGLINTALTFGLLLIM